MSHISFSNTDSTEEGQMKIWMMFALMLVAGTAQAQFKRVEMTVFGMD